MVGVENINIKWLFFFILPVTYFDELCNFSSLMERWKDLEFLTKITGLIDLLVALIELTLLLLCCDHRYTNM